MLTQLSANQLRHAADLVDAIEKAKKELSTLLGAPAQKSAPKPARRPRVVAKKGAGRPATIAGTVRAILAEAGKPLSLDEIIKALAARGRPLRAAKNARKIFAINLSRMAGVKKVGKGTFAAA